MAPQPNHEQPADMGFKIMGEYVRIFPLPGQEQKMAADLFCLAEKLYGPDSDHTIDLITDNERPYIRIRSDLAEQLMRGAHKTQDQQSACEGFDPAQHSVSEVIAHLINVDELQQHAIVEAERVGKARKTILGWSGR